MIEQNDQSTTGKQKGRGRGFLSMTKEQRTEAARKGGRAAHAMGTAHKWTSEEAQAAGRKGGSISRRGKRTSAEQIAEIHARIVQQIEAES